ncbi:MAG: hypothetical protein WD270_12760 [Acetobacterales bacterium]
MLRRHLTVWLLLATALPALAACSASEAGRAIREAASDASATVGDVFSRRESGTITCGGILPLHSTGSACAIDPAYSEGWAVRSFELLDAVALAGCGTASPRLELAEVLPQPPTLLCRYRSKKVLVTMQRPAPADGHCTVTGGLVPAGLDASFDCR